MPVFGSSSAGEPAPHGTRIAIADCSALRGRTMYQFWADCGGTFTGIVAQRPVGGFRTSCFPKIPSGTRVLLQIGSRDRLLASRVSSILFTSMNRLGEPRHFAGRCPIGWRVRSNMCLNSDRSAYLVSGVMFLGFSGARKAWNACGQSRRISR